MFKRHGYWRLAIVLIVCFLVGCKVEVTKSSNKEITNYWFTSTYNSTLSETVKCSISGTNISCSTPYGTDVTGLVATFNSTGESVKVGSTVQTSGSTANNFSSAVTYTVMAEDKTTQNYTVSVVVASASDKSISSFKFLASKNSALSADVTGTVYENSHTVGASVPAGTNVTSLCPTIGFSGNSISPANEETKDFANPVSYTVTAADGTTQSYDVTVTVQAADADTSAPTNPSISINSGASSTTSTTVSLSLSANDNVGIVAYYASETGTTPTVGDAGWKSVASSTNYSGSVSYTLSSGTATKAVYVWFKDGAGNISSSSNDSITLNDLANGLVAYYPFNGNANDESGNGYNGTVNGATLGTDRSGNSNRSYSFDGSNDTISLAIDINDGFSRNYSFSVWIYRTSTGTTPDMVIGSDGGGPDNGIQVYNNTIQARFMGANQIDSGINPSSSWHHVAATYDGTNETGYLYVDGVFKISGARGSFDRGDSITIGALTTSDTTYNFGGIIDDIRIYNRVLSASEITALYSE